MVLILALPVLIPALYTQKEPPVSPNCKWSTSFVFHYQLSLL